MSIRTLPTTLLQIFHEIILYFQVIVISVVCPDDNFSRIYKNYWVKPEFWESDRLRLSCCVGKNRQAARLSCQSIGTMMMFIRSQVRLKQEMS